MTFGTDGLPANWPMIPVFDVLSTALKVVVVIRWGILCGWIYVLIDILTEYKLKYLNNTSKMVASKTRVEIIFTGPPTQIFRFLKPALGKKGTIFIFTMLILEKCVHSDMFSWTVL